MKRLPFIAALLGIPVLRSQQKGTVALTAAGAEPKRDPSLRKFYVTGGQHENPLQGDCNVSPLICWGRDRMDAISRSGITVWTEEEWADSQKQSGEMFKRVCAEIEKARSKK